MPRFVLLAHDWPEPHFDLLIEREGVLKAWRVPIEFDPDAPTALALNADHRLDYLEYEGPISGERGQVSRVDAGLAEWEHFDSKACAVILYGQQLRGRFLLSEQGEQWEWRRGEK